MAQQVGKHDDDQDGEDDEEGDMGCEPGSSRQILKKRIRRPLTRRVPRLGSIHETLKPHEALVLFSLQMLPEKDHSPMYRTLLKELLRNAAKARIRRMISDKKRRTDLAAPPMVKEQWEKGTAEKDEMAQLLQDTNWDKELGSNHHPSKSKLSVIHFSVLC